MTYEGEIAELDLVGRLVQLWSEKFTGALRFERDGIIKILYLKEGDILSASTNDRTDSLDEVLLRGGKINRDHIKQAMARRKENETLGDALLGLGFITRKELTWARRIQVIGIIRSILAWTEGNYTLVSDYLPKREEGTLFYLPQVILELIVTDPERGKFAELLEGGAAVFERSGRFAPEYPKLGLNEDADAITAAIDGQRSASEIAETTAADVFNVYKLLHALDLLGLLVRPGAAIPEALHEVPVPDSEVVTAPVLVWDEELAREPEPSTSADIAAEPEPAAISPASWSMPAGSGAREDMFLRPQRRSGAGRWVAGLLLVAIAIAFGIWGGKKLRDDARAAADRVPVTKKVPNATILPDGRPPAVELGVPQQAPGSTPGVVTTEVPEPSEFTHTSSDSGVAITHASDGSIIADPQTKTTAIPVTPPPSSVSPKPVVAPAVTSVHPAAAPTSAAPAPKTKTPPSPAPKPVATTTAATNPAATPESSASDNDPNRQKYDTQAAQWARALHPGEFAVQFELVCQTDSLRKAIGQGGESVWYLPVQFRGKGCYRVLWGRYPTRSAATEAISQIPAELRSGSSPTVVEPGGR